jgi:hypothetical protein
MWRENLQSKASQLSVPWWLVRVRVVRCFAVLHHMATYSGGGLTPPTIAIRCTVPFTRPIENTVATSWHEHTGNHTQCCGLPRTASSAYEMS